MTSILVVEDHTVFAQSLVRLLKERGNFEVATAGSGEQAVERVSQAVPDLVVIDVSLPGMSGIRLIKMLHDARPGLPCVMLSGHLTNQYVVQSMAAGARGYILKDDVPGIMEGILLVLNGGTYISPALREK